MSMKEVEDLEVAAGIETGGSYLSKRWQEDMKADMEAEEG